MRRRVVCLWALRPNTDPRQTVNTSVPWNGLPVFGFGQDEAGEVYVLTSSPTGEGVFRLAANPHPAEQAASRAVDPGAGPVATAAAKRPSLLY